MAAFEYLGVFISIILGLGITQLLASFAGVLRDRHLLRLDDTPLAWAAMLVLLHVQTWWALFELRDIASWTFLQFAVVLLQPALLFLLSALVLPPPGARLDLGANFAAHRRWFFGLMLALVAASLAKDLVLRGRLPVPANLAFHAVAALAALGGWATPGPRVQRALAWAALVAIAAYIGTLFNRLS
ncbi:hypothetical protein [Arenimonas sp.]|uniref:hypothetical protein n=1 Tax=Arenimonas sp. TaxID=1872635 RepID=UPI0035B46657